MSLFLLRPVVDELADPAWGLSWHAGPCRIAAASPEEARCLAAGRFTLAVHPDPEVGSLHSPWFDQRLVTVEPIAACCVP